ncbi:hypothetical protein FIV00_28030 [Labrenzia sp. THAF82]|uniref:DUF6716 putative glycosyltransferase n=1 Tax=Labrenzia sp. THAF82 TaxID=2587861 RepID=UPI00126833CF|nr:DUF6716 putative glycosyltransferase [Labrenzia sp. THAF82]QFT34376.1 hypothetical protein FIV00_28030 [Labrenzia sp. THAF82]
MKMLALAGYDSFLNTARLIAPSFEKCGVEVDYALVRARKTKQISPEQVAELGVSKTIGEIDLIDFCESGAISQYDIVLACLEGLSTRRLFQFLPPFGNGRPIVISAYPGLVLRYLFDGLATRATADFLWLNCRRDMREYARMCEGYGIDPSNARLFGNGSVLDKIDREPDAIVSGPIVFFEQAVIPRHYDERRFLVEQLFELARRHHDRQILIKARVNGNKATLHRTWHAIDSLFSEVASASGNSVPPNLALTQESTRGLLAKASLCLTVSSTVSVEALYAGVPTLILNDFGAHDDYGLQYFYGSGILRSFSQIDPENVPVPVMTWLEDCTHDPSLSIAVLVAEAVEAARNGTTASGPKNADALHSIAFLEFLKRSRSLRSIAAREFQRRNSAFGSFLKRFRG